MDLSQNEKTTRRNTLPDASPERHGFQLKSSYTYTLIRINKTEKKNTVPSVITFCYLLIVSFISYGIIFHTVSFYITQRTIQYNSCYRHCSQADKPCSHRYRGIVCPNQGRRTSSLDQTYNFTCFFRTQTKNNCNKLNHVLHLKRFAVIVYAFACRQLLA